MLIDLNADLGEGAGTDAELMPLVTSANVCCGAHAGGPDTIVDALELARVHHVTVGAHPGYADREHFGRRELDLDGQQVTLLCLHQLGAIRAVAAWSSVVVRYVKAHGALYNQACRDPHYAFGVVSAAGVVDPTGDLPVIGLPGSQLQLVAAGEKHPFIPEGFADRRYRPDGSLVPRTEPDAMIHDPKEAVDQVEWLIGKQQVRTICVHGDTPGAVEFVKAVRGFLLDRGHELRAFA
jgi:5-oxoprolinase (ATP-hydrolysing) subunit A